MDLSWLEKAVFEGVYDGLTAPERRAAEETEHKMQAIMEQKHDEDMFLATGALVDAGADDDKIILLMRNYFGLSREDAKVCLYRGKNEFCPYYRLREYMIHQKGYSEDEADGYLNEWEAMRKMTEKGFYGLSTEELYKTFDSVPPNFG